MPSPTRQRRYNQRARDLGLATRWKVLIFATFKAIGWNLGHYQDSFTAIQDFRMYVQEGKYFEIRLLYLPGVILAGNLGFMVDMLVIPVVALCRRPCHAGQGGGTVYFMTVLVNKALFWRPFA